MLLFAFPGTGKTTLSQECDKVVDLELAEIKYDNTGLEHLSKEERKSLKRPIKDRHYRRTYVEAALSHHDEGKLVLVALDFIFLILVELYKRGDDSFHVIIPKHQLRREYKERYRSRGNNTIFIRELMFIWTPTILFFTFFSYLFPSKISLLSSGETLSTFLHRYYPNWLTD